MRYNSNKSGSAYISLDDYISQMKPGQEKIYFIVSVNVENAKISPFMEPFKNDDAP
jgi:HSP90 family molecular chaperone